MNNLPWSYKFDHYAEYDCMSAGYVISDCNNDDKIIIDVNHFGYWHDMSHSECPEAKNLAELIVNSVNNTDVK